MKNPIFYTYLNSSIGELLLAADETGLISVGFPAGKMARRHESHWILDPDRFRDVVQQLNAYFAGELRNFNVRLALYGTNFQARVWKALQDIPYGATSSYADVAASIGSPKASRAVGAANARNPVPIIVPCHRVIGKSGNMVGFGGGIKAKQQLLSLERLSLQHDLSG